MTTVETITVQERRSGDGCTPRYAKKREAIIGAATAILNRHGVKGMTLADVAASVGLITTSVTYYFKKKEDLAAACFLRGVERLDVLLAEAALETTPQARLARFLTLYFDLTRRIVGGEEAPLCVFSDAKSLTQPHAEEVGQAYGLFFRRVRDLFNTPDQRWMGRKGATTRTHLLLEQLWWSVSWLPRYDVEDFDRVRERMYDILLHGLAPAGVVWAPQLLPLVNEDDEAPVETSRETFLEAATALINQRGYRGASVEKISAHLNVTKGSFYHHNDAKDDLVVACFERTYDIIRRAQRQAIEAPGSQWDKLCAAAASLVRFQLSAHGPLLRSSALSALPEAMRGEMVDQANRLSGRFASMIADGVAEGSVRAVDPAIAAQMLSATINAAAGLSSLVPGVEEGEAADIYAKPLLLGLFTR